MKGTVDNKKKFHPGYIATKSWTYSWPAMAQPGLFLAIVLPSCELYNKSHFSIHQITFQHSLTNFMTSAPNESYIIGVSHGPVKSLVMTCCPSFVKLHLHFQYMNQLKGEGFHFAVQAGFLGASFVGVKRVDFSATVQFVHGECSSSFKILYVLL